MGNKADKALSIPALVALMLCSICFFASCSGVNTKTSPPGKPAAEEKDETRRNGDAKPAAHSKKNGTDAATPGAAKAAVTIDELCGGGKLRTAKVKNPLTDPPGSTYKRIVLEKGEHICIGWDGADIHSVAVNAVEPGGSKIRLASYSGVTPSGRKQIVIPYNDFRYYKYFSVSVTGKDSASRVVATRSGRALAYTLRDRKGMADDFAKIFAITNMGYDAYDGAAGCGQHGVALFSLALKYGFMPRLVDINYNNWGDTHVFTEIFVRSMNEWIAFDPTFSVYYTVGGKPAGVLRMHNALVRGKLDSMGYVPFKDSIKRIETYYINPKFLFKNVAVGIFNNNPDNSFCYVDEYSVPWSRCRREMTAPELWYLPPENIKISDGSIVFHTGIKQKKFPLGSLRIKNPIPRDARRAKGKKYFPMNDPFRSLVYHKKQYLRNGDFERDGDGDGIADGWTAEGVEKAGLTGLEEFTAVGKKAQYLKFGPRGGSIRNPIPVERSNDKKAIYHLMGFAMVKNGSARIDIVPDTGACCDSGDIYKFSQRRSHRNWNFLMSSGFHLDPETDRTLVLSGTPGSELFVDDFRLYKLKRDKINRGKQHR